MQSPDFFELPSEKTLEQIARELGLSDLQRHELDIALQHARADLELYYRNRIGRGPRKVRMRRLRSVDQALAKLITLLDDEFAHLPFLHLLSGSFLLKLSIALQ